VEGHIIECITFLYTVLTAAYLLCESNNVRIVNREKEGLLHLGKRAGILSLIVVT
jgi:hypothetical protein